MSETPQGHRAGRGPSVALSADARSRAVHEVMTVPLIEPATLAVLLNIGLVAALREARAGRWGAFKVGRCYKIPSAPIREALSLPAVPVGVLTPPHHVREREAA